MLDKIKLLWEELNAHHCQHSLNFKDHYNQMNFEKRKFDLLKKSMYGKMRVDLAVDEVSGCTIGYCVSSISREKTGEIESIFVNVTYRSLGIGDSLIKNALHGWIKKTPWQKSSRSAKAMNNHSGFMHDMASCLEKQC